MAAIIYEKNTNGLIATGERAVSTFGSGLVRVDRKYVCRSSAAALHRATLAVGNAPPDDDGAPCIDGLFIFPQPQELQRGDGFTEFQVSAYGRTENVATINTMEQTTVIARTSSGRAQFKAWDLSGTVVIPYNIGLNYEDLGMNEELFEPFDVELDSFPSYQFLSATRISRKEISKKTMFVSRSISRLGSGSGIPKSVGFNDPVELKAKRYRSIYEIRFQFDGVEVPGFSVNISVNHPIIKPTATRNFGYFSEIDFVSERDFVSVVDQIV